MSEVEKVKIFTNQSIEIDDKDLVKLDAEERAKEEVRRGGPVEIEDLDPDQPYSMEIVKPRAVDLRKLYKLAKKPIPADIEATLGPKIPVLIYHGFTPFHKPGVRPKAVWGMGYEVSLRGLTDVNTVSVEPEDELTEKGEFKGKVDVGLAVGGKMQVKPDALKTLDKLPGFDLHKAEVNVTTDNNFSLAINLKFSALKIQSGAVGSGGAKWNIYRQEERIDVFQPLLQTILVPEGTKRLKMVVQTWIRRRGRFFGLLKGRAWMWDPLEYSVSLSGL